MRRSWALVLSLVVAVAALLGSTPAGAADPGTPTNQVRPTVSGTPQLGSVLTAAPGTWSFEPTSYGYVWLRDGSAFSTPSSVASYTVTEADLGHTLAVRVTATNEVGSSDPADSDATVVVSGTFVPGVAPRITGVPRWGRTLTGTPGTTTPEPTSIAYQ